MFFFEGSSCPVCGNRFSSADDVVACPICGAPHHRECYKSHGGCSYEEQHAEGFIWKRETETPGGDDDAPEVKEVRCPVCGMMNPPGRLYCQNCTNALFADVASAERRQGGASSANNTGTGAGAGGGFGGGFFTFGSFASPVPDGELIDDVPVGDMRRFLGNSSYNYIPTFIGFANKTRTISFNLIAFFMHGMWFISRKMYVFGGAVMALMLGIFAFQTSCFNVISPAYDKLLDGDMSAVLALAQERPVMMAALFITSIIQYSVYILSGLFGNRIYYIFCLRSIRRINAGADNAEQFNERLESEGGQSLIAALAAIIIYFALEYVLQMWLL